MTGFGSPCGACKFLRRKCVRGCVFAPYFCHEQGAAHFAAIHKVFGASNVSKLLAHLPLADRPEAAVTISYEAQARLRDPIYGCVAHIFALQQQVPVVSSSIDRPLACLHARMGGLLICVVLQFDQVMTLQAQLASLKAQAAQGQGVHEDAKGYMGSAAEQLGYGYPWCNSNGGAGAAGAPAAQPSAYGNGGHESLTALLGSDYMYHAFEQAGEADDGRQAAAFEAAADSSSFGAEESGWRSSSGYQDCEDLQSVAYAYLNHRS
ncbi:LOB domain-containing protein 17 [Dichanthelium oligosanthes]|uniref:LOB domain-containing protein 17 n=1 Tax=Dichanthelium oligosanthes TaxID=888268 RepID=A0A1E5WDL5_9POAL|nr:LOB domain-containing protein 17 [Dichanthelium oligosanthes]